MTTEARSRTLTLEREYGASPERLFRAWTDPEELALWFAPNPELTVTAEVDLRVGGRYRVAMGPHVTVGVYQVVEPPRRLAFTWRWETEEGAAETLVTVEFEPLGEDRTRVLLRHDRFPNEAERSNHEQGWIPTLDRLNAAIAA